MIHRREFNGFQDTVRGGIEDDEHSRHVHHDVAVAVTQIHSRCSDHDLLLIRADTGMVGVGYGIQCDCLNHCV